MDSVHHNVFPAQAAMHSLRDELAIKVDEIEDTLNFPDMDDDRREELVDIWGEMLDRVDSAIEDLEALHLLCKDPKQNPGGE
jgi:hypothetical protein